MNQYNPNTEEMKAVHLCRGPQLFVDDFLNRWQEAVERRQSSQRPLVLAEPGPGTPPAGEAVQERETK